MFRSDGLPIVRDDHRQANLGQKELCEADQENNRKGASGLVGYETNPFRIRLLIYLVGRSQKCPDLPKYADAGHLVRTMATTMIGIVDRSGCRAVMAC